MNDLATAPTADLIAEWVNAKLFLSDQVRLSADSEKWNAKKPHILDRKAAIAAELDRRCEDAQIAIIEGVFCFHPHPFFGEGKFAKWRWIQHVLGIKKRLLATELHALLGWLLLKEGGRGA